MTLKARFAERGLEAGCDEAGRGCLAGPVFAAAVILPDNKMFGMLNDSKKLSATSRETLRKLVEENAFAWAVARIEAAEIDKINILNASILAMHRALDNLKRKPERILVDGNRFHSYMEIPHHCIIKGDGKYLSIAAASILAKTHRDEYMEQLHAVYPAYGWHKNKGYPTAEHRRALGQSGISPHHRKSFTLLPSQLKLPI